jgi:hypothetical protein
MRYLSTALLIGFILLLPLLVWAEHTNVEVWQNRLAIPFFEDEPNRHTPVHTIGTFLPPTINHDLTLTPADNPILLTTTTHINPDATLTLTPGTTIYAHEFANIIVSGQLIAQGNSNDLIQFISNEAHPLNQTWGGITIVKDGQATISQATFHHASPTITCLLGSSASITSVHLTDTSLGLFSSSPSCHIRNSRINSTRNGIVAINNTPTIINTKIFAAHNDMVKKNH